MRKISFYLVLIMLLVVGVNVASEEKVQIEQPFLITSIGQSPDWQMVRVLGNRLELDFASDPLVEAADLEGYKAIFMVVGGSSKGLGAAGIDANAEIARTKALIEEAKEMGIIIVGTHVGGAARRGPLSDQFVEVVFPASDLMVVMQDADEDGYFSDLAAEIGVDLYLIEQVVGMTEVLQEIVK